MYGYGNKYLVSCTVFGEQKIDQTVLGMNDHMQRNVVIVIPIITLM
jgi:hypothetical protein